MDFVGVDIGASGTRYVTSKGNIFVAPNNMVKLGLDEEIDLEPYNDEPEAALELRVSRSVNGQTVGQWHVLFGSLAKRHQAENTTPSMNQSKHTQEINLLSAVMAAALGSVRDSLNPKMGLYLALPPAEVKAHAANIRAAFEGSYDVEFVKKGWKVHMDFVRVMAYEESFMALLDFFFQMDGKVRPEAAKYATGNVLSMDIGASTTDMALVSDMKYLEHTGQTYHAGGNVATQHAKSWVSGQYGFDAPDSMAEQIICEGRIPMGNGCVECRDEAVAAKRALASKVAGSLEGYFRQVNVPIQSLRAIVVSGGGSLPGGYVDDQGHEVQTSPSVSEYITEYLQGICPNVEVERTTQSPRLANVRGLFIRGSMDAMKFEQAQRAMAEASAKAATMQVPTTAPVVQPVAQPVVQPVASSVPSVAAPAAPVAPSVVLPQQRIGGQQA